MMIFRLRSLLVLVLLSSILSSCALFREAEDETKDWSANQLLSSAKAKLMESDYEGAIKYYEILEARYPLGRFAQQAQLDLLYAYYKFEEPESSIVAADRFIKLYPRHPRVDYAYYIKGLANFDRNYDTLQRYLPIDLSQRDQETAKESFESFAELVRLFPESRYAEDSRQRMVYLRNNMALHELHVADFYVRRGAHLAALNRAQYVVQHFDRTTAVPDALAMMVKMYKTLGYGELAEQSLRVLKLNYPDYPGIAQIEKMAVMQPVASTLVHEGTDS